MHGIIEWLYQHLLTCPSKHFLHFDCPGCGLQRSIIALFEGDFVKSAQLYPATVPLLFCLLFTALHVRFDFRHGAAIIKATYIATSLIIMIFYIYKIVTHKIF